MAYTAPPTFAASDPLAADELNVLGDDIVYLYGVAQGVTFSGGKVSRTTNQSIPDSTDTAVTFTTEEFDFGGWWSSGTLATVPSGAIPAGFTTIIVMVVASLRFVSNGTGTRQISVMLNGTTAEAMNLSALSGEMTTVYVTTFVEAAAGDTLGINAWQSSGGALNLNYCRMAAVRYAPAS